jgi:hypothetical protein
VKFNNELTTPQDYSANEKIENDCQEFFTAVTINTDNSVKDIKRSLLPGFRFPKIDEKFWQKRGWNIDDYLPCCGIHPTAAAFGIARAMLAEKSSLYVHYNCHASGKQALVVASTKI